MRPECPRWLRQSPPPGMSVDQSSTCRSRFRRSHRHTRRNNQAFREWSSTRRKPASAGLIRRSADAVRRREPCIALLGKGRAQTISAPWHSPCCRRGRADNPSAGVLEFDRNSASTRRRQNEFRLEKPAPRRQLKRKAARARRKRYPEPGWRRRSHPESAAPSSEPAPRGRFPAHARAPFCRKRANPRSASDRGRRRAP